MKHSVAIGTHHKTGTHWMRNVFRDISRALDLPFIFLSRKDPAQADAAIARHVAAGRQVIVFHDHSEFPPAVYSDHFRGLRLIRDPRDVLISAVRYHETTDAKWVNEPRGRFGGQTLKARLAALPDLDARLLYEIEHVIGQAFERMEAFAHGGVFKDLRYEDLVMDRNLSLSRSLFDHLGFEGDVDTLVCCVAMWQNSLFGALDKTGNDHIKDGSGRQHERVMSEAVRAAFDAKFADVCQNLGYGGPAPGGHVLVAPPVPPSSDLVSRFVTTLATPRRDGGGLANALTAAIETIPEPGALMALAAEAALDAGEVDLAGQRAAALLRQDCPAEALVARMTAVLAKTDQDALTIELLERRLERQDRRETVITRLSALLARTPSRRADAGRLCAQGLQDFPKSERLLALQAKLAA